MIDKFKPYLEFFVYLLLAVLFTALLAWISGKEPDGEMVIGIFLGSVAIDYFKHKHGE